MKNQTDTEQLRDLHLSGETLTWNQLYRLYEAVSSANFSAGWMGYPACQPNISLEAEVEAILRKG